MTFSTQSHLRPPISAEAKVLIQKTRSDNDQPIGKNSSMRPVKKKVNKWRVGT